VLPAGKCTTKSGGLNLHFEALYADGDDAASRRFNDAGPSGIPFLYKGALYISSGPGFVNSVSSVGSPAGNRELYYAPACIFEVK
jgi:hypothetical protein